MKITITKISDDRFEVDCTVGAEKRHVATCATQNEARACACGIQFGASAIKTLIGLGPFFDGNISQPGA